MHADCCICIIKIKLMRRTLLVVGAKQPTIWCCHAVCHTVHKGCGLYNTKMVVARLLIVAMP